MNSHVISDFLFGKKWKMKRKFESICGNGNINKFTTAIKYLIVFAILALIFMLLLQSIGIVDIPFKSVDENGNLIFHFSKFIDGDGTASAIYNPKDVLETIIGILTVTATIYTCLQIYLMKDINRMEMSHQIYKDNQEYRKSADDARKELHSLYKKIQAKGITVESEQQLLKNNQDSRFHKILVNGDYETLRAFAYHYEYIGYLTLRDKLNFDVAFDTITFYNWLIVSDEAKVIIEIGRQFTPDFWNGSEYLYCSYEVRRKYNKYKACNSTTSKETKKALKSDFDAACEKWEDKYNQIS